MKYLAAVSLLMFGANAFGSVKLCTGASNRADTAGQTFQMEMTASAINLVELSNNQSFVGEYPANGQTSVADGHSYLHFEGDIDGDHNLFKVDRELLNAGTVGKVIVDSNFGPEGTLDGLIFTCRDNLH